jgi:ketosteroid isomerase-like protein
MKTKFIAPIVLCVSLLFAAFTGNAQDGKKIIAVVNKADWCHICQANGEKIMKEVMPVFENTNIHFVMNDLTNDATKEKSKGMLMEYKVYGAVKKIDATGLLLLVDAETGKLLEK